MNLAARARHVASTGVGLALALGLLAGCGGAVVFDEGGAGGAGGAAPVSSTDAGGGTAPLTCDVVAGPIDLVPDAGNPAVCRGAVRCEVWFGHGQHLSCPGRGDADEPSFVECSIWDCVCTIFEEDDFAADFASGDVVDARAGVSCLYTLVPAG